MAVGTTPLWSGSISSPQQLASVIQGEAGSDPASQFAVASVMYNRFRRFRYSKRRHALAIFGL